MLTLAGIPNDLTSELGACPSAMIRETNTITRLASMLIDHFAMTFIAMIFFIPNLISIFARAFIPDHEPTNFDIFGELSYLVPIGFALYLCKDSINGRSIAKRVFKIQIVNDKTGEAASPLKCFVRNLFCVLWPLEVIVTIASPDRRIGDMVAGTKIVPFNPDIEQPKPDFKLIGISITLAYGLMLLLMLPFEELNSMLKTHQFSYIETSLNDLEAQEVTELFDMEFEDELTADVRIYDEIEEDPNLKYISVILTLTKNYLDSDDDFNQLEDRALSILLSKYSKRTFVGQIKYVFKQPGSIITKTRPFNWLED